jgi:hypothetical protein
MGVDLGYNFELVTVCKSKSPSLRKSHVGGLLGAVCPPRSCTLYLPEFLIIPAVDGNDIVRRI